MLASTTSIDGMLSTSTFRADAVKVLLVDAEQASGSLLLDALIAEGYEIAYTGFWRRRPIRSRRSRAPPPNASFCCRAGRSTADWRLCRARRQRPRLGEHRRGVEVENVEGLSRRRSRLPKVTFETAPRTYSLATIDELDAIKGRAGFHSRPKIAKPK